jgi:hypothetical protein
VEILKQPQFRPMAVEDQVISIFAVTQGFLDRVPVESCRQAERELLEYVRTRHPGIPRHIAGEGTLSEEIEARLRRALDEFLETFVPEIGEMAPAEGPPADAEESEELGPGPRLGQTRAPVSSGEEDEGDDAPVEEASVEEAPAGDSEEDSEEEGAPAPGADSEEKQDG